MIPSETSGPVPMCVIYRAKTGHEDALLTLVHKHYPVISKLGLATSKPPQIYRLTDREGAVAFLELFEWRDSESSGVAHESPEVMAVWEPMANVMEGIEIMQAELLE